MEKYRTSACRFDTQLQHLSRIHPAAVYGFEGKEEFHCLDSLEISKTAKSIEAFCWGINQHWRFEVFLKRQVKWINWKSPNLTYPYKVFSANTLTLSKKDQKRMNCPYSSWSAGIPFHGLPWCTNIFIRRFFLARPTALVLNFKQFWSPCSLKNLYTPMELPSQHSCLETRMDLATSLSWALRGSNQRPHFTQQKSWRVE